MIAIVPPKCIIVVTKKQIKNAAPAVINQPPITDNTPVIRYSDLSRLDAVSASELHIATLNAT